MFWYRLSPRPIERETFNFDAPGNVMLGSSPLQFSGDVLVRLDAEGRLRTFEAMPPQAIPNPGPPPVPDWSPLFAEAGLDISKWTSVEPQWNPLYYADTVVAWEGKLWEFGLFIMSVSFTLFAAGFIWILYIALEPLVRRRWPQVMVSWTRLLAGEWRDPLVGRDILVGSAAGIAVVCLDRLRVFAPSWFGYAEAQPLMPPIAWFNVSSFIARLLNDFSFGIWFSFATLFLLLFLRIILRKNWAAAGLWIVALSPGVLSGDVIWIDAAFWFIGNLLLFFVVMRFGLVAMVADVFVNGMVWDYPLTLHASAWYASAGDAALLIVFGITLYGFRTSLGGRRLLDLSSVEG